MTYVAKRRKPSGESEWNKDAVLPAGLRRAAAQPGGGGCHERKAVFMIKRVCLGNNRQLYFYVQNIQREVQRRAAPLLVWRRAKISLRMVCAALRRKPSGGIMRVKNGFIIERK